ncbi:MAG TPA: hypothetical protein VNW92_01970, partial [Polyangiaceae bacterium]|nr:hypothetical protein [Polyangiaceae bacterium]
MLKTLLAAFPAVSLTTLNEFAALRAIGNDRKEERESTRRRSLVAGACLALCVLGAGCGGGNAASDPGVAGSSSAGTSDIGGAGASSSPGAGAPGSNAGSGGHSDMGGSAGIAGAGVSGSAGWGGSTGLTLPTGIPNTVLLDGAVLAKTQAELAGGSAGTSEQQAALKNLIAAADLALRSGTWTVTSKDPAFVINTDAHEYVSWAPYAWPSDANPPSQPGTFGKCPYVTH